MDESVKLEAKMDTTNEQTKKKELPPLVANFEKTYKFEGKEYDKIDLSGMRKMNTTDSQELDDVMRAMGRVLVNKFRDTMYCKHVAMRATSLPVEFFNALSMKDINEVGNVVQYYFLVL